MPAFSFSVAMNFHHFHLAGGNGYTGGMVEIMPVREVALRLGEVSVRWYGVMYVLAFGLTVVLLLWLQERRGIKETKWFWLEVTGWLAAGAVIGGRLGYVLIYDWAGFESNPLTIFQIQNGGMSAHGGVLGVALALVGIGWWLKRGKFWEIADLATVPAAAGLCLGRLGNLINQELYGTVTSLPWGVMVTGVSEARHPWPLYEAGWLLALGAVSYVLLRRVKRPGVVAAVFLTGYGLGRFVLEIWREPEWEKVLGLSPGQWWSLVLISCTLFVWRLRSLKKLTHG